LESHTEGAGRQPLDGLRALELPGDVALSYTSKLLADFGAEVIKVEPPGLGDCIRRRPPFVGGDDEGALSALFLHLNSNKSSITLDVTCATGQSLFRRLAATAQIVLESFRPGTLAAYGLGFSDLVQIQPNVVLTSVTPFGQTGPYAQYQGEDIVCFAMGGMSFQGILGRPPLKLAGHHVQYHAGNVAAMATMAAVLDAESGGAGRHVDVAMVEAQNGSIDARRPGLVSYQYTGEPYRRRAEAPMSTIPSSIFPVSDGYVQIMTIPAHVPRMLATLASAELDDFFGQESGVPADSSTKDMIDAVLLPWLLDRTKQEATVAAQSNGWALMPFNAPEDVLVDPQLLEREFFVDVEQPGVGSVRQPGAPFRMANGWRLKRGAPELGSDNDRIYRAELGLGDDELDVIRAVGAI
jgi:benzylsuccinate CoA-transferase BbsE subunit